MMLPLRLNFALDLGRAAISISKLIGENLIKSDPLESHNGNANRINRLKNVFPKYIQTLLNDEGGNTFNFIQ